MLEIALKAAKAGLYVFPVQPGGKTPVMTPRGPLKWGSLATTDEGTIHDWWVHRCPTANIGVAAKPSRLLIVDCDMPKENALPPGLAGQGVNTGEDAFCAIAESLGQPFPLDTLQVATPSGGAHYFYRNPLDIPLRNSSLVRGWVDIRANGGDDGGYVVAPGSHRDDGGAYAVCHRAPIAVAPDWLIELCKAPPPQPTPDVRRPASPSVGGASAKTDGLVNNVRYAQEGNRNNALMWSACKYAEEQIHIADAEQDLVPAALEAGLTRSETLATISSAYRKMGGRG